MPIHPLLTTLGRAQRYSRLYVLAEFARGLDPAPNPVERPKGATPARFAVIVEELEQVVSGINDLKRERLRLVEEMGRFEMLASPFSHGYEDLIRASVGREYDEWRDRFEDYYEWNLNYPIGADEFTEANIDASVEAFVFQTGADELARAMDASSEEAFKLCNEAKKVAWNLIDSNTFLPDALAEEIQARVVKIASHDIYQLAADPAYLERNTGLSMPLSGPENSLIAEEWDDDAFDLLMRGFVQSLGWGKIAEKRRRVKETLERFPQASEQSLLVLQQASSLVHDHDSTRELEVAFELDSFDKPVKERTCQTFQQM